jgi:tRNA(fMet)-specific endonuclease VapC
LRGRIDYLLKAETGLELLKAQELLFRTEKFVDELLIIPISQVASEEFDRLRAVSKFRKIGRADLLIASITLAKRATLVTRNMRHFKQIPGLKVVNWVD